ncbi:MAG TPA: ATP-dependent DNA helicase [Stellaceae bacterium]|nr:ATP-dependent DNA helicase [Stellaceae bacterium]
MPAPLPSRSIISAPEVPVLVLGARQGVWLAPDGEVASEGFPAIAARLRTAAPILVHAPSARRLIGGRDFPCYDLLELFAFVLPARFCLPTPRGLAAALGIRRPHALEDQAMALLDATFALLGTLARRSERELPDLARLMEADGWPWAASVLAALGVEPASGGRPSSRGLDIWQHLPEWSDAAPPDPPGHRPVEPAAARRRLAEMVSASRRPGEAEPRPQQADYASSLTPAFAPRPAPARPNVVLAEAGTGVGKTLGYLAPATLWAEANGAPVWISTFTRNLQAQIDAELDRRFPDPAEKRERVVLRKGRENYLCLLNFEEAVPRASVRPGGRTALALLARWAMATKDGALVGGDFPGWLPDLMGRALTTGLADRRGECIYSACPHYARCFIEGSVRRARRAEIVIANHALVMVQAALGGLDDGFLPSRYVFDEGHHLFEAADSAFAIHLSGLATAELRRWLLGVEGGQGRARGLRRRIEGLVEDEETARDDLQAVLVAAAALPGEGWLQRVAGEAPRGPVERFLAAVRGQVLARTPRRDAQYDIETERHPLDAEVADATLAGDRALAAVEAPAKRLTAYLDRKLDAESAELESEERLRIEAMIRSLDRRALRPLAAWRAMLRDLQGDTPDTMVDWFSITRVEGQEIDVGLHRHWIDPTVPFVASVIVPAHGVAVTSATLTDGSAEIAEAWQAAEWRTGAVHLAAPAIRARVPSPFDYAAQTRAFVVTDVRRDEIDHVAAAYRELFLAAGGGALGLFTAIARLRAVHQRLAAPLDAAGLPLLAQHVDGLDVSTLVDIFRAEEDACLLGTDAVRDGVDVPGRSLRLIVFDRVPWPRPSILHKTRRKAFGGAAYDERLTRLKLRQAFGRLIRRADDAGVFVLLDRAMPSRLASALPEGVALRRVGLAEAIAETRAFLGQRQEALETTRLLRYEPLPIESEKAP